MANNDQFSMYPRDVTIYEDVMWEGTSVPLDFQ